MTYVNHNPAPELREDVFYYPKNLRSKNKVFLWTFGTFLILLTLLIVSVIIWSKTSLYMPLVLTGAVAFLTASFDDITLGSRLLVKFTYFIKPQQYKNATKPNSTQKLLGGQYITPFTSVYITDYGRYAMWQIQPFNLSVLSPAATETLIRSMTYLLSQVPNIEILATDAARSFEQNIGYLKRRIEEEENPAIKALLEADLEEVTEMSASTSNSRRYLFLLKMPANQPPAQDESTIKRTGKSIQDAGFNALQLDKKEIKRVLANNLDIVSDLPDIDGEQFTERGVVND